MTRLIRISLGFALGLTGSWVFAQQAVPVAQDGGTQETSVAATAVAKDSGAMPSNRNCLRTTGSLIHAKPGHCLPVNGRSYSGDELRATGRTDTGRALQTLDPSIRVSGW